MEVLKVACIPHIIDLFPTTKWTIACGVLHLQQQAGDRLLEVTEVPQYRELRTERMLSPFCACVPLYKMETFPFPSCFASGNVSLSCGIPAGSGNFLKDACFIYQCPFCCHAVCTLGRCALLLHI